MSRKLLASLLPISVAYCDNKSALDLSLPEVSEDSLPALIQQAEDIAKEKAKLPNPGQFENIQNETKRVLTPDVFDGCRVEFNKNLGPKFAVSHVFWLGSPMIPEGLYQFGANVVIMDDPQPDPENPDAPPKQVEPDTLLISRLTPEGTLDARWHQKLTDSLLMKVHSSLKQEEHASSVSADFDYSGEDFCSNVKITNGTLVGVSYLQSITQHLAMGGEGYYHGKHKRNLTSFSGRYKTDKWTGIATFNNMGQYQFHYMNVVSDRVRLASEFVYNSASGESAANVGGEFVLKQSRFLTNIDCTGKISSALETKIAPGFKFLLSAEVAHAKNEFKFGYGVQLG